MRQVIPPGGFRKHVEEPNKSYSYENRGKSAQFASLESANITNYYWRWRTPAIIDVGPWMRIGYFRLKAVVLASQAEEGCY